jgi:hypothetical protein
MMAAGL